MDPDVTYEDLRRVLTETYRDKTGAGMDERHRSITRSLAAMLDNLNARVSELESRNTEPGIDCSGGN